MGSADSSNPMEAEKQPKRNALDYRASLILLPGKLKRSTSMNDRYYPGRFLARA